MLKRKEIFTQTRTLEKITISQELPLSSSASFCSKCGSNVGWLSVRDVSALIDLDVNEIRELISRGELDVQIDLESIVICAESVRRVISRK